MLDEAPTAPLSSSHATDVSDPGVPVHIPSSVSPTLPTVSTCRLPPCAGVKLYHTLWWFGPARHVKPGSAPSVVAPLTSRSSTVYGIDPVMLITLAMSSLAGG